MRCLDDGSDQIRANAPQREGKGVVLYAENVALRQLIPGINVRSETDGLNAAARAKLW